MVQVYTSRMHCAHYFIVLGFPPIYFRLTNVQNQYILTLKYAKMKENHLKYYSKMVGNLFIPLTITLIWG